MPHFKMVTLQDQSTGDYLVPRVFGTLRYEVQEDGTTLPPFNPEVDLSEYMKTADADKKYALKEHTHDGVYSTVDQYNELKTSVSEGKSLVAAAVTDKGVQTAADATFQQMATNIGNISTFNPLYNTIYGKDISISLINQSGQYANMLITIDDERLSLINPNRVAIIFTSGNTNIECIRYVTKISRYTCSWTYRGNPYGTNFNFSYGSNRITLTSDQFTYIGGVGPSYDNQCVWFAYRE